ncbi:MAG: GGDEF domain-containing protein [Gemmatimonadales bacterium]|nr:GGDEF domain-containing protein [Gemmatimonadales bacterium]
MSSQLPVADKGTGPFGEHAGTEATPAPPSIVRALDQSEQVQDKVEQCAAELSSVNAVLKEEIAAGVPLNEVERALERSEEVEVKVQECAQELATVNDALAEEIDQRSALEHKLSESKAQERRSRHLAFHDAATGLPNLALFNDRLDLALAQAQRHAWRLAIMFIDLDEFKSINDTHGHDVGDRVLQKVAQRLQAFARAGDTVSRRGGDEFLFLMIEAKDETNAANLAARLIDNIAEAFEVEGLTLTVRPSVGIALYPEDGGSAQELLKNADKAMYVAKQQKRGSSLHSRAALAD